MTAFQSALGELRQEHSAKESPLRRLTKANHNDRGDDEETRSENAGSARSAKAAERSHTRVETTHHKPTSPGTVQLPFRIRRAYNPK
jgi:hypothetical protein